MDPLLAPERLERVWAWGRAASVMSYVWRPTTAEGVAAVLAAARARGLTVGLRGGGQSYGDAALNAEHVSLDLSRMTRILDWNPATGLIRVEPGVTIRQLWQYTIEDGWWPPVVSGTMFASLGGGAAMNIHGKNNWKVGPIGDHIQAFELLLPTGEVRRCSREADPELFHAAIGGFGMLGCFLSITLQMKRVHSGLLDVEPLAARNLDDMIRQFEERLDVADYLVGWVDGFAGGDAIGRGLIHRARYLHDGEDPAPAQTLRVANQELPDTLFGVVPKSIMWRLVRPAMHNPGVRLVNAVKYRLGVREHGHGYRQSHAAFAFLFDYIPDWKRAYGPGGMIEYQSFLPADAAAGVFKAQLALGQSRGIVPYIAVFKRHRADPFLMTHALDGYSLAMHYKVPARDRRGLWALAADFDRLAVEGGGRFYFAKDLTLGRDRLERFLAEERVQRFLALKRRYDPDETLQTELYRRLIRPAAAARLAGA